MSGLTNLREHLLTSQGQTCHRARGHHAHPRGVRPDPGWKDTVVSSCRSGLPGASLGSSSTACSSEPGALKAAKQERENSLSRRGSGRSVWGSHRAGSTAEGRPPAQGLPRPRRPSPKLRSAYALPRGTTAHYGPLCFVNVNTPASPWGAQRHLLEPRTLSVVFPTRPGPGRSQARPGHPHIFTAWLHLLLQGWYDPLYSGTPPNARPMVPCT